MSTATGSARYGASALDRPVFIICMHRTGSTLLKNLLDAHPDLTMLSEETDIDNPWRLGLCRLLRRYDLSDDAEVARAVDAVFDGRFHGTFWQRRVLDDLGIARDEIARRVLATDRSCAGVFAAVVAAVAERHETGRAGVKFPLHFSRVPNLLRWYPDGKIIFLTRDPRAMIASKIDHPATVRRKQRYKPFGWVIHYVTLLFFVLEFNRFVARQCRYRRRYSSIEVRYEDLVSDPDEVLGAVFDFCELASDAPSSSSPPNVAGQPSSHTGTKLRGVSRESLTRWRSSLSRFDQRLIRTLCAVAMRRVSYA